MVTRERTREGKGARDENAPGAPVRGGRSEITSECGDDCAHRDVSQRCDRACGRRMRGEGARKQDRKTSEHH